MFFANLKEAPIDPIFGLKKEFLEDTREKKVFLSIGVFKTEDLKAKMISSVKKAMENTKEKEANYLPLDGDPIFLEEIGKLIFGKTFFKSNSKRIYAAQTIGGTSALRVGGENILRHLNNHIFLTNPTWNNHAMIFKKIGFEVFLIPYYSKEDNKLDFENFIYSIETLPEYSVLVLHCCCHNPTGADPTKEQWKEISEVLKKKKIFPFFDFAYQGFNEGTEKDAFPIRYFAKEGHEMFIAYSCSKNFSLYRQRVGALIYLSDSSEIAKKMGGHIKRTIRVNYSNPPSFGAKVVAKVLKDPILRKLWLSELKVMSARLRDIRFTFSDKLSAITKNDFSFIEKQRGMFSLTGLNSKKVRKLKKDFAIYMPLSGRINVAGLSSNNLEYVVSSINEVL